MGNSIERMYGGILVPVAVLLLAGAAVAEVRVELKPHHHTDRDWAATVGVDGVLYANDGYDVKATATFSRPECLEADFPATQEETLTGGAFTMNFHVDNTKDCGTQEATIAFAANSKQGGPTNEVAVSPEGGIIAVKWVMHHSVNGNGNDNDDNDDNGNGIDKNDENNGLEEKLEEIDHELDRENKRTATENKEKETENYEWKPTSPILSSQPHVPQFLIPHPKFQCTDGIKIPEQCGKKAAPCTLDGMVEQLRVADAAKCLVKELRAQGTTYHSDAKTRNDDENWNGYKSADCTQFVAWVLEFAGYGCIYGRFHSRQLYDQIVANGGSLRKTNPLVGDIMFWGGKSSTGHVAVVTGVKEGDNPDLCLRYANVGSKGAVIQPHWTTGCIPMSKWKTWGSGGFNLDSKYSGFFSPGGTKIPRTN